MLSFLYWVCWGCATLVVVFESFNIFFLFAWATAIPACMEATSLWKQIKDEPLLFKPPYHPDLIPGSKLAAATGGVLLVTTVTMFVKKNTSAHLVWVLARTAGQIIMVACYTPALVLQSRYLHQPLTSAEGCRTRFSWPPGSGVSDRYPTMFSLIPNIIRKGARWNSCERLVTLFYEELAILAVILFSVFVSICTAIYIATLKVDNQNGVERYPLHGRDGHPFQALEETKSTNRGCNPISKWPPVYELGFIKWWRKGRST